MPTYLDRYLQGEHEQVWAELLEQGAAIHQEPLLSDALAVTRETMKRTRYNIEQLILRLNTLGYVFGVYPSGYYKVEGYLQPLNPPRHDIAKKISQYETLEGISSFPLSLRIFWEIVGDVDLTGHHPTWPRYSDPLVIFPVEAIDADYSRWRYQIEEGDAETEQFGVPISADYFHKDNVSGGEPYRIRVPNYTIDGILENERHETTLVNYLRICFRYGGFPGLRWLEGDISRENSYLVEGLMPI